MATDRSAVVVGSPPLALSAPANSAHRWYVVNTIFRMERRVQAHLDGLGFGTFLPTCIVKRVKRRMRWGREYEEVRKREVLAFPTYLFVCFDIGQRDWRFIPRISEVRCIMGPTSEHPLPVPEAAMRTLMAAAYDRAIAEHDQDELIAKGVAIQVAAGPLEGHIGVCEWDNGKRVMLNLSILGRETPIEMPRQDVRKVEA